MQAWVCCKACFFIFVQLKTYKIDHIWTEYDHILLFTNYKSTLLRFSFTYTAYNGGIVEKAAEN